jgi:CRISPR-associated endonuclease Csn1
MEEGKSKKVLGLDLGTNSIGWSLVEQNFDQKQGKFLGMGSRIIPMSQDILGNFDKGNSVSQTAERTRYWSIRHLRERHLLRRERLHRVLNILGFLPNHYAAQIDFEKRLGQYIPETEPKLAYNNRDFLFKPSFEEMLKDFKANQPSLLNKKNLKAEDAKIPYDWTIYYLRKKALTQKIKKEELAWILLNFNQKRGYYQLRGEDEDSASNINEYVERLNVVQIEKGEPDKKNNKKYWYNITLENGWVYSATFSTEPQWLNTEKEFLVTEELDDNGNIKIVKDRKQDKDGKEKRKITPLPSFEEIDLMSKNDQDKIYKKIKAKTEITISNSGKTVGVYIYDALLQKPDQKIRGKLIRTIERKFYKDELNEILKKQIQLQPELFTESLYDNCVRELYRNNENQQISLSKRDFAYLFIEDIIFYQRPLRSQKSSIGNCSLEYRIFKDKDGNRKTAYLKVIPKSHPLYQEFRIWQWMYNLKIHQKDDDNDATSQFIASIVDQEKLFDFLNTRKEIDQKGLLKYLLDQKGFKGKILNAEIEKYRWNYVEDKSYPCNETGYEIRKRIEKVADVPENFLTAESEYQLWQIIYSVTDSNDFEKALKSFVNKHQLNEASFVENFRKFPHLKSEYGAYSEKAIKKLLSLMRLGKYWNWEAIDNKIKERIDKIITAEYDKDIKDRVREKAIDLTKQNHFQGLQLWLAQYIVYDRHSEAALAGKWNSVADLEIYLKEFKQHSLRNPIVEQVVTETLRVVKDIWVKYGNGAKDYFHEIHIELGREMKHTAEERGRLTNLVTENENTNLRIKALLVELRDNSDGKLVVDEVRPYSPMQQEALKVFEDGILNSNLEIPDDILKISKTAQPTKSELQRYKLWLEQKYRSPYTGKIIPLNKLFTEAYQIEHIIPQSRYFDDSFSNKVICEAAVNQLKDKQLGLEFIKNHHGEKIEMGLGQTAEIFSIEAYQNFVKENYAKSYAKRNKLLLEEIPDKMIERQMNDTRYISKFISNLLSNIVRADNNDDGINSKNIIPVNGRITSALKQDWGLENVWNELILPRFERLNQLTNTQGFTSTNTSNKVIPTIPLDLSKGFQKKRIDHRHHALDALTIACATRDHVNLLNNIYAKSNQRLDLQRKLRKFEKIVYNSPKSGERIEKEVPKDFIKPWENFTKDAKDNLEKIVVSFKQNLRVINKTTNKYQRFVEKDGEKTKEIVTQTKGESWAIRKPLHKDTVSGEVKLNRIKIPKGKVLTATRKTINTSFDLKTIESITDTGTQKILKNYLSSKGNNPELAFSPEGLDEMNKNIALYNNGKPHQPIYKARIFELGSKFPLGQTGNKKSKFVEAAKGTNLFFAVYADKEGQRNYETIPLNIVIERQKQGLAPVPELNEKGDKLLFYLSPNDIVYIPNAEEQESPHSCMFDKLQVDQIEKLYKIVSFTGNRLYAIPCFVSLSIFDKVEFSQLNKVEFDVQFKKSIKENCWKININRLGDIGEVVVCLK